MEDGELSVIREYVMLTQSALHYERLGLQTQTLFFGDSSLFQTIFANE